MANIRVLLADEPLFEVLLEPNVPIVRDIEVGDVSLCAVIVQVFLLAVGHGGIYLAGIVVAAHASRAQLVPALNQLVSVQTVRICRKYLAPVVLQTNVSQNVLALPQTLEARDALPRRRILQLPAHALAIDVVVVVLVWALAWAVLGSAAYLDSVL